MKGEEQVLFKEEQVLFKEKVPKGMKENEHWEPI